MKPSNKKSNDFEASAEAFADSLLKLAEDGYGSSELLSFEQFSKRKKAAIKMGMLEFQQSFAKGHAAILEEIERSRGQF